MKPITALTLAFLILAVPAAGLAEPFAKVGTFGGQFARIPVDARGEAMGLATTVNPLGPMAFWWNPAPLPGDDGVAVAYTVRDYAADLEWRPLAVRATRGNLTFGLMWSRLSLDPMLVRTAYEPDGDGETFDAGSDLLVAGCAADLAPWLAGGPTPWEWSVGANLRYLHMNLAESTVSGWDADLGTTLAWTGVDDPSLRLRLLGTAMVRNLMTTALTFDEIATELPRYYHLGLGLDAGLGGFWRGERMVTVTVSHTWRRYFEDAYPGTDNEHLGLEVLLGGVVALRRGHRDSMVFLAEGWSWGVGLQWRFDQWQGARAAVDYARTDQPEDFLDAEHFDHWTFTVGVDLP